LALFSDINSFPSISYHLYQKDPLLSTNRILYDWLYIVGLFLVELLPELHGFLHGVDSNIFYRIHVHTRDKRTV